MSTLQEVLTELDMGEDMVRGVRMRVFRQGTQHMNEWYDKASTKFGSNTCLVDGDSQWTYSETMSHAHDVAFALRAKLSVKPEETVAIAGWNSAEWVLTFFGATMIGAIAVPLNSHWVSEEMHFGLKDSGAVVAVVDQERLERLLPAAKDLLQLRAVTVIGGHLPFQTMSYDGNNKIDFALWSELIVNGESRVNGSEFAPFSPQPEDPFLIMYTSGTTGNPKGVVLTQRCLTSQMDNLKIRSILLKNVQGAGTPGVLINVPLFHATGLISSLLLGLGNGRKQVIFGGPWDPAVACRLIEQHRLTQFIGVPTQSMELVSCDEFKRRDMSSLISIGGGGAAAPTVMVERIHQLKISPNNGYGLTETTAAIIQIGGADWVSRPLSCGKATPLMDVRVINPDPPHSELLPGEAGELVVRGPLVFCEYWNNPSATAKAFLPDGWFRTGDMATMDNEGYVTIVDRLKDLIVRGGENISCVEVEDALYQHPAVVEVGAIGLPNKRLGEEVAAVMILSVKQARPSADDLTQFLGHRLAKFKVPTRYFAWPHEKLPRGGTGKTLKREIKSQILSGSLGPIELFSSPTQSRL